MKYWEIIADRLSKAGWSLGWVSAVDSQGHTIWIADAHRDDGKRFVVRADELLIAIRVGVSTINCRNYAIRSSGQCASRSNLDDEAVACFVVRYFNGGDEAFFWGVRLCVR